MEDFHKNKGFLNTDYQMPAVFGGDEVIRD